MQVSGWWALLALPVFLVIFSFVAYLIINANVKKGPRADDVWHPPTAEETAIASLNQFMASIQTAFFRVRQSGVDSEGSKDIVRCMMSNNCTDEAARLSDPFRYPFFQPYVFEHLSDQPDAIITIGNRIPRLGTDEPELLIVVPRAREDFCKKSLDYLNKGRDPETWPFHWDIQKTDVEISLVPYDVDISNPEDIVTLPDLYPYKWGCIKAKNGLFFVGTLLQR